MDVPLEQTDSKCCILCMLECTEYYSVTDSTHVDNDTIIDAVCKHFWFMQVSYCDDQYICTTCWDMTYSFYKFYIEIELLRVVKVPGSIKQDPKSPADNEEYVLNDLEQYDPVEEEGDFIEITNEIFVKDYQSKSDTETDIINGIQSMESEEESSDVESSMPLSLRRKIINTSNSAKDEKTDASNKPPIWTDAGLSLCAINGNHLDIMCHTCFLQADGAKKCEGECFTFANLMKHYRKEHNAVGYAVCCNRKYLRRRSLKMHIISHGRKVIYRCLPCNIKFRKKESLDEHNVFIHTSDTEKQFKCDKCHKSFAAEFMLHSHQSWHAKIEQKNIICKICNVFFFSIPSLEKHQSLHHPPHEDMTDTLPMDGNKTASTDNELVQVKYRTRISSSEIEKQEALIKRYCILVCNKCEYIAESFTALKQHMLQEHALSSCDVVCCERTYTKRQSLYEHCLVHENPDCFMCDVCKKRYSSSRSLQSHKWRIHTPVAERRFSCDVCGETFVKDYLLKQHLLHHLAKHKKLNYCDVCQRSFTTASVLKCHKQTYHGEVSNWICDICARGFNSRSLFETHRLTHTVEGKSKLKHQCGQCKKWLRNKKSYQQHRIRCHGSNGPVKCKFCGKESVNPSALKSHVHLHHASRPEFPCTFCKKTFKTPLRLREHEATHTGEIMYRCPWCPRTFACGSNMYKHKKASHPVEWSVSVKTKFGQR